MADNLASSARGVPRARWRRRLVAIADWLYGPDEQPTRWWRVYPGFVALLGAGTLVMFFRIPGPARNVLWAEDASIFTTGALQNHPFGSFFVPYAGYMQAFPRLAALAVVHVVPLTYLPQALALVACAIAAFVAALIVLLLRPRMPALLPRLAIWLGIVTLPIAGIEVNGSIANSHWYLMLALFAIVVTRQHSATMIALSGVTVSLAVMSDTLAALALPLILLRFLALENRRQLWIPLVYVGSLVVQLAVTSTTHLAIADGRPVLAPFLRAMGFRVFLATLAGESHTITFYQRFGLITLIGATVVAIVALVWAVSRGGQLGGLAAISFLGAVVFFSVAAWIRWLPQYDPNVNDGWGSSRYSVVPISLLILMYCAAIETWRQRRNGRILPYIPLVAFVALLAAIAIPDFTATARNAPQTWTSEITHARHVCANLSQSHEVDLAAAPSGWKVTVSCGQLEGK
ncbi:MAG: hypothetical protein QOH69_2558 [Actinomycetota bacterium]|jgi:hypothetical protein|nr:hypothetical protein [Actinomycetota bacterium]